MLNLFTLFMFLTTQETPDEVKDGQSAEQQDETGISLKTKVLSCAN